MTPCRSAFHAEHIASAYGADIATAGVCAAADAVQTMPATRTPMATGLHFKFTVMGSGFHGM